MLVGQRHALEAESKEERRRLTERVRSLEEQLEVELRKMED